MAGAGSRLHVGPPGRAIGSTGCGLRHRRTPQRTARRGRHLVHAATDGASARDRARRRRRPSRPVACARWPTRPRPVPRARRSPCGYAAHTGADLFDATANSSATAASRPPRPERRSSSPSGPPPPVPYAAWYGMRPGGPPTCSTYLGAALAFAHQLAGPYIAGSVLAVWVWAMLHTHLVRASSSVPGRRPCMQCCATVCASWRCTGKACMLSPS